MVEWLNGSLNRIFFMMPNGMIHPSIHHHRILPRRLKAIYGVILETDNIGIFVFIFFLLEAERGGFRVHQRTFWLSLASLKNKSGLWTETTIFLLASYNNALSYSQSTLPQRLLKII